MVSKRLTSREFGAGVVESIEFCFDQGWTDGLPVMPPTAARILDMLAAAGLTPDAVITRIEDRQVTVTAEKVAINAVLAGCMPEYMPVVVAALQSMGDPAYGFHGPATSTGGSAVFMLVNGPLARALELNCGESLFGPGWRANTTIGRAVRLLMRNVMGTLPGELDRSTFGHAGKGSFCIAENEAVSQWSPVHVERGFKPEQSTVTVMAALAPQQVYNELGQSGENILYTLCEHMRISAGTGFNTEYVLVIAEEHMNILVRDRWTKADIREFCHENTRLTRSQLKRLGVLPGEVTLQDDMETVSLVPQARDFMVVAAGGPVGGFSAFIPGWGDVVWSRSVTREIKQN